MHAVGPDRIAGNANILPGRGVLRTGKVDFGEDRDPPPAFAADVNHLPESDLEIGKQPLIARFSGTPLRRQNAAILTDQPFLMFRNQRNELLKRLLVEKCELCGTRENIEVHHIRELADLNMKGRAEKPAWAKRMAARHRKTLVVCQDCHRAIHAGRPIGRKIRT